MRSWVDHRAIADARIVANGDIPIDESAIADRDIAGRHDPCTDNSALPQINLALLDHRGGVDQGEEAKARRTSSVEHPLPRSRKSGTEDDRRSV